MFKGFYILLLDKNDLDSRVIGSYFCTEGSLGANMNWESAGEAIEESKRLSLNGFWLELREILASQSLFGSSGNDSMIGLVCRGDILWSMAPN